jgi:hypothetical protein
MSAQDIVLFGGGHAHVHVLKSLGVRLVIGVGLHTTRFTDSLEAGEMALFRRKEDFGRGLKLSEPRRH